MLGVATCLVNLYHPPTSVIGSEGQVAIVPMWRRRLSYYLLLIMVCTFISEGITTFLSSHSGPFPGFIYFRAPFAVVPLFLGSRPQRIISVILLLVAVTVFLLQSLAQHQLTEKRLHRIHLLEEKRANR